MLVSTFTVIRKLQDHCALVQLFLPKNYAYHMDIKRCTQQILGSIQRTYLLWTKVDQQLDEVLLPRMTLKSFDVNGSLEPLKISFAILHNAYTRKLFKNCHTLVDKLEKSSLTNWIFSLQKSILKLIFVGYTVHRQ